MRRSDRLPCGKGTEAPSSGRDTFQPPDPSGDTVARVPQASDKVNMGWRVRPLTLDDVEGIARVQATAYEPGYHESSESFVAKLAVGDGTCFGVDDANGELAAYLVALPCHPGFVMPFDAAPESTVPLSEATCLYVHDLAVSETCRGHRLGDLLWAALCAVARAHGIGRVELVSVQNSVPWWEARGFSVTGVAEGGYGAEAVRMVAPVAL